MGCCFSEPTIEAPVNIHTYPQPQPQLQVYGVPANIPISQIHANGNGYGYVYGNIYGNSSYQPPFQPEIPQPGQYYQGEQLLYPQSVYQPYQSSHLQAPMPSAPPPPPFSSVPPPHPSPIDNC